MVRQLTTAELEMVAGWKPGFLWPTRAPYAAIQAAATPNQISPIVIYTPDIGGGIYIPAIGKWIAKLWEAGPTEADPETEVLVGVKYAGHVGVDYLTTFMLYEAWEQLSKAEQNYGTNDSSLTVDLGQGLLARDGDEIVFASYGPSAVDLSLAGTAPDGTALKVPAKIGRLTA